MIRRDYYYILQLTSDASVSEIKSAYRRLALEYHPDHHPEDTEAEEKFKLIGEAYSVLGDEQKRKDYDRRHNSHSMPFDPVDRDMGIYRHTGRGNGCGRRHCGFTQQTIFNSVQPGQIYEVSLTPEEARFGTERLVEISSGGKPQRYRICIPEGVTHGMEYKTILGRRGDRHIFVRVTISS
ncbi:MAG: Chaperone protein DnaJ [Syntrophorhabdus sp. PtaU1.Bin153]|nr:MAG: Chaperone protein DnaJ [Syntrophorhabdus sp. PtaU1.Bin153]